MQAGFVWVAVSMCVFPCGNLCGFPFSGSRRELRVFGAPGDERQWHSPRAHWRWGPGSGVGGACLPGAVASREPGHVSQTSFCTDVSGSCAWGMPGIDVNLLPAVMAWSTPVGIYGRLFRGGAWPSGSLQSSKRILIKDQLLCLSNLTAGRLCI